MNSKKENYEKFITNVKYITFRKVFNFKTKKS